MASFIGPNRISGIRRIVRNRRLRTVLIFRRPLKATSPDRAALTRSFGVGPRLRSRSDLNGRSANNALQTRGVCSINRFAGCCPTRCRTWTGEGYASTPCILQVTSMLWITPTHLAVTVHDGYVCRLHPDSRMKVRTHGSRGQHVSRIPATREPVSTRHRRHPAQAAGLDVGIELLRITQGFGIQSGIGSLERGSFGLLRYWCFFSR